MHRAQYSTRFGAFSVLAIVSLAAGCTGTVDGQRNNAAGGSGNTVGNTGGMAGANVSNMNTDPTCAGSDVAAAKRIVRLSFNQVTNSIGSLIDATFGTKLVTQFNVVDAEHRGFPPLASVLEGPQYGDGPWGKLDNIAQAAGQYVFDNFATVTGCGATPTDACATTYLNTLAQKAYRRPLTADEQMRLTTYYTTTLKGTIGATINEAVQYSVYAILQSPAFVYRTEFGPDWTMDGQLTPYETASMLSYFLTDNMPDQPLLEAAAKNKLATPADLGAQVDRLLMSNGAKTNLNGAMMSYFRYPNLETVVIQDDMFTGMMRQAMYHEAELFLQNGLWTGKVDDLLTSKKGYANATLAPIYGVTVSAPGPDGFGQFDLPAGRSGLLTQAGFLANTSRPNDTSVVARGLLIKNAVLCTDTPAPPASVQDTINMILAANPDASQRDLANIRATTSPCNGCHATFDAYGLALDTFDELGRYRMNDPQGRPIDTTVTLPDVVGGGTAKDIVEVAQKLAATGGFGKCLGKNLINFALADVSNGGANIDSCSVKRVSEAFTGTDQSFSSLLKAVATSAAFTNRSKGVAQ